MNEKDIIEHLKNGISEIAPNCLDNIMEKISDEEDIPSPKVKKWKNKKIINCFATVAACFIVLAGSYEFLQNNNNKVATVVDLDVNPSIELGIDKSNKVVEVTALNSDGAEIMNKNLYPPFEMGAEAKP